LNHESVPVLGMIEDNKSSKPAKTNIKKVFVENKGGQLKKIMVIKNITAPFSSSPFFSKSIYLSINHTKLLL
jgi:hypothetical protein